DGERSALEVAEFAESELRGFRTRQHCPCFRQEGLSGLGQFYAAADAIKKLGVVARFERRDRVAHRRLRNVQELGGLRHVLSVCHRDKHPKLIERHVSLRRAESAACTRGKPAKINLIYRLY